MAKKAEINPAETHVMDEMENLEATLVLDDAQNVPTNTDVLDDEFLDDIEDNTVVLGGDRKSGA